ncbi:alpha/beta hydrolase [Ligilactobacillus sp. WILCCON 0076]|uniref:Alpha/beta hydrolase n=1 Tax=Ligilactobacillus ubinensis TaxID=2876789 RepID=A0A9X2JLY5_9LACO|nr:alpha/beta hydrolase [Ligilactobacillus ubinensis]MCP0887458.1 alpha/beta hydrolase [Ligilactobacillus ubinensis]
MATTSIKEDISKMRALFKQGDDKRDAGLPREVPEVQRYDDISYGPDKKWHLLDIYIPKEVTAKIPVIINIHGGGWCYGTKETYQFYGLGLAKQGFAFVNPNYRLAPDVEFPAELDDVNRYIHWVDEHADEYNLDRNNVFLIGDSAGGQMVEQYITLLTNEEYRTKFGYELTNLNFRAAAMNSAAFFVLDPGMIGNATAGYFTDLKTKRELLDTEKYIDSNFLPVYLSTANEDFIHDQTIKFDGFLTAKGIEHITKSYGNKDNPQGHVFLINQKDDIAAQANKDELDFFRKYIVE